MGKFDFKKRGSDYYEIKFLVIDPTGFPINGVEVSVNSTSSSDIYYTTTNLYGQARLGNIHKRVTSYFVTIPAIAGLKAYSRFYSGSQNITIQLELESVSEPAKEPWNTLTFEALRNWKGNFCGFKIDNLPYQKYQVAYTPSYLIYEEEWRAKFREGYQARGYTHFPVVIHNGPVYSNIYPDLTISTESLRESIKKLYYNGIIPVVTTHADWHDDVSNDFKSISDLIRIAFVKWEMNQPDGNDPLLMAKHCIQARKAVREDCLLYVHFSPKHSSGVGEIPFWVNPLDPTMISAVERTGWVGIIPDQDDSNSLWWQWLKKLGFEGILLQADKDDPVQETRNLINDFTERFAGLHNYPDCNVVIFEVKAARSFHDGMLESEVVDFNNQLRNYVYKGKKPTGYCNG